MLLVKNRREDLKALAAESEQYFGENVRQFRVMSGMSQADLAKRLTDAGFTMHQTTVAKLEKGNRPTAVGEVAALASVFDIPIGGLFTGRPSHQILMRLKQANSRLITMEREFTELKAQTSRLSESYRNEVDQRDRTAQGMRDHPDVDYFIESGADLRDWAEIGSLPVDEMLQWLGWENDENLLPEFKRKPSGEHPEET